LDFYRKCGRKFFAVASGLLNYALELKKHLYVFEKKFSEIVDIDTD
jgi:hypothetical protein